MNKVAILSIAFIASIAVTIPNVYAEEGGFFDWLMNLFGGFDDNESTVETVEEKATKIKKAVIIDQLYLDFPNESFQENATKILMQAGYEVDLVTTEDITVDFYKQLPTMDYEFIVMRTHSLAIYGDKPSSWIFTGEMYSDKKHTLDTMSGLLSPGVPFFINDELERQMTYSEAAKQRQFMIGSKLIDESMEGTFPGSIIVMGGCETMAYTHLADSFIDRGASLVVGWNELVGARQNDNTIMLLLEEILVNGLEVDEAIDSVMKDFSKDKTKYPKLKYQSTGAKAEI